MSTAGWINAMMECLLSPPRPNEDQLAKISELEAAAARHSRERSDSQERSDTDGFLSQWASGLSAELARREIELLRNGGFHEFPVLVDADGNVVADRIFWFTNEYSFAREGKWKLSDELSLRAGRKWIPIGKKSRVQKQLGFREEKRFMPAYAKIAGSGKGLSGSAWVAVFPIGQE